MESIKEIINTCITDFADNGDVFSNEAQFQFALAWKLKEKLTKETTEDVKILLEHLVICEDKKYYIDILARVGEDLFPIELKYKTPEKPTGKQKPAQYRENLNAFQYGDQYVFPQGAEDEGSYYFLKDVERLEKLKVTNSVFLPGTIKKGYAVLLTNSEKYWKGPQREGAFWAAFSLKQGRRIGEKEELCWGGTKSSNPQKWGGVQFAHPYSCCWLPKSDKLPSGLNLPFRYLLWEIG